MIGKGKKCNEPTIHYWKHWKGPIQAAQQKTQGLLYCISGTANASNQEKATNDTVVAMGRSKRAESLEEDLEHRTGAEKQ